MENYKLSTIFLDVYSDVLNTSSKPYHNNLQTADYANLENTLIDYLTQVIGYKFKNDYTLYFREIRRYFENIIFNTEIIDCENINQLITEYKSCFFEQIKMRPISSIFLWTVKKLYSNDPCGSVISQRGNSYIIERIARKEEDYIPPVIIKNIDELEICLNRFIKSV